MSTLAFAVSIAVWSLPPSAAGLLKRGAAASTAATNAHPVAQPDDDRRGVLRLIGGQLIEVVDQRLIDRLIEARWVLR